MKHPENQPPVNPKKAKKAALADGSAVTDNTEADNPSDDKKD